MDSKHWNRAATAHAAPQQRRVRIRERARQSRQSCRAITGGRLASGGRGDLDGAVFGAANGAAGGREEVLMSLQ